jgi:N-acetylglucosamine-6-sulfatase
MAVDDGVGRLLEALERTGQLDNTIIIFASDNGYLLGEHGRFTDKRFAYDESIRIPFLVRYPPLVPAGTTIDALCLNVDLAPTLLDLAGVQPVTTLHGRSLLPLLSGSDEAAWRDSFLAEHFLEKVVPAAPAWKAVRTNQWKYIHYPGLPGMDELYNLKDDPGEVHNLITEPDAQPALTEMKSELERLLAATQ